VINKAPFHEDVLTYWRSGDIFPRILKFSTVGGWVVSFTPRPLYPMERNHWIGVCVGPRADLYAVAKRKMFQPLSGIKPQSSSP